MTYITKTNPNLFNISMWVQNHFLHTATDKQSFNVSCYSPTDKIEAIAELQTKGYNCELSENGNSLMITI